MAYVEDFGIARIIDAPTVTATEGLTRLGEIVGTPEYMSPEQATGDHVDGRSDLYSLGLTAYFALIGTPAVAGDTTGKVLARQITERLPEMRTLRSDLPAPLADAIDRCVAKDPSDRFPSAEVLVETLDLALLSVLVTRVLQTFREVRRTRANGFSVDDIKKNLLAVVDEREARRKELRSDRRLCARGGERLSGPLPF